MYPTNTGRDKQVGEETEPRDTACQANDPDCDRERSCQDAVAFRSPAATGASTATVINALVDSGPTDSWGDDPNMAYSTSGNIAPQSDDR